MKKILFPALITALVFTGCIVTAVYPFYTPKDIVFDPALLGAWAEPGKTNADKETWTFEKLDQQAYTLTIREKDKTNEFDVIRFALKGNGFLDCLTRDRAEYNVPSHLLLRITAMEPNLEMAPLNYEWLGKLIEKNPKAIRHVIIPKHGEPTNSETFVLSADTAELQKFVLKHVKNTNAWGDAITLSRQ